MNKFKVGDRVSKHLKDPGNATQFEDPDASIDMLTRVGPDQWSWGYKHDLEFCGSRSWPEVHSLAYNDHLIVTRVEDASEPAPTVRAAVLDEAKRITATDRNSSYGEPEDNFQRIADFWNVWLQGTLKDDLALTKGDVAALMILVKMAREMNAPTPDNKIDLAGYAACWAEVDAKN
jgi:Domain of unknown function (DUF6378)